MPTVKSKLLRHSIQQVSETKQFRALAFCDRQQVDSKTSITLLTCNVHFFSYKQKQCIVLQRWSRGHKVRGQGHKKNPRPRPRTAFPRTDTLEAKDRNARGQGQGPRTQSASALQKKKKRSSQKFFKRSPLKNVSQKIFQALHKILTFQKIVLSSSKVLKFTAIGCMKIQNKFKKLHRDCAYILNCAK